MTDIIVNISTDTLGDNTTSENERYRDAVLGALKHQFEGHQIEVNLDDNNTRTEIECCDEVKEIIAELITKIWDQSSY